MKMPHLWQSQSIEFTLCRSIFTWVILPQKSLISELQ